ncbi:MAG: hypothetical protein HRT88_14165 [Lentisphaeraceae bacterium]|nr:hypothetical protein [Lentisphaeraceae bacterium]
MAVNVMQHFSMSRAADSIGPLELLVFYLNKNKSLGVVLEKNKDGVVSLQNTFEFEGFSNKQLINGPNFSAICKKNNVSAQYCALVLASSNDITRILSIPNSGNKSPQVLSNLIGESLGKSKGFSIGFHQMEDDKGDYNSILACLSPHEIIKSLTKSVSKSGMKLCSLELEGGTLSNYTLAANTNTIEMSAYLYIGDTSSHLMVNKGNDKLYYSHKFHYGLNNIVEDMCKDKNLPEDIVRDFFKPENDLDFSARLCREITSWIQQICTNLDYMENSSGAAIKQIKCFGPGANSSVLLKALKISSKRIVNDQHCMTWINNYTDTTLSHNDTDLILPLIAGIRLISPEVDSGYAINFCKELNWTAESQLSPVFLGACTGLLAIILTFIGISLEYMKVENNQKALASIQIEAQRLSKATQLIKKKIASNKKLTTEILDKVNKYDSTSYSELLEQLYNTIPSNITLTKLLISKESIITKTQKKKTRTESYLQLAIYGTYYGTSDGAPAAIDHFNKNIKSGSTLSEKVTSVKVRDINMSKDHYETTFSINCTLSVADEDNNE